MYAVAAVFAAPRLGLRMLPALRGMAAAAPLLLLGPASALSQSGPGAPTGPMRVTTDTQEYCEALAERVERAERIHGPHPAHADEWEQVRELASEGHQMCVEGLIRSGLVRLRRALLLLSAEK